MPSWAVYARRRTRPPHGHGNESYRTLHRDARAAHPDRHPRHARRSPQRAHTVAGGWTRGSAGDSDRPRSRWQDGTDARAHGPARGRRCRNQAASDCRLAVSIAGGTPTPRRCRRGDHRLRSARRARGDGAAGCDRRHLHGGDEVRRHRTGGAHVGRELSDPAPRCADGTRRPVSSRSRPETSIRSCLQDTGRGKTMP